jgi:hypothetical protein
VRVRCWDVYQPFVDAFVPLRFVQAQHYQSLASLPLFPRRDSVVVLVRTQPGVVLLHNSHRKDRPDSPHVLELQGQHAVWRSSSVWQHVAAGNQIVAVAEED